MGPILARDTGSSFRGVVRGAQSHRDISVKPLHIRFRDTFNKWVFVPALFTVLGIATGDRLATFTLNRVDTNQELILEGVKHILDQQELANVRSD